MNLRQIGLIVAICLSCCQSLSAARTPQTVSITVVERDTLSNLAKTHLADPSQWRAVARLNRLANPDLILPGQVIAIPVTILKGLPFDGRVTFLAGDVTMRSKGATAWIPLKQGDTIAEGNSVRTGSDGTLEVSAGDGTSYLLRADTTVSVATARQGEQHLLQRLMLQAGRIITRIKTATGRALRYEIQTPSSVAAARGTVFQVSVDEQQVTRSEVREGIVDVAGSSGEVEVTAGMGTVVRPNTSPLGPRPLLKAPAAPPVETAYRSLPITIAPPPPAEGVKSRLMLAADPSLRQIVREAVLVPGQSASFDGLADGTYHLALAEVDDAGLEGYPSETVPLKLRVNPLPPMLMEPAANAVTSRQRPAVSWLKVTDAASYRMQFSDNREFGPLRDDVADIAATSWTSDRLPPGTYFYRVLSRAADGYEGAWSPTQTITIIPPPAAPAVKNPDTSSGGIRLRWGSLGPDITYQVQVARDPAFTAMEAELTAQEPTVLLPRPPEAGSHYVRIRGIDREGQAGEYSVPQSFEITESSFLTYIGIGGGIALLLLAIF